MSATSAASANVQSSRPVSGLRDTRLDVLRALALLMIFVDHVPGQPLEHWTMKNFGFSDASELFVLISGIAVALAYGRKYDLKNLASLTVKAWKRVGTLFVAHMTGTLLTLAILEHWFMVLPLPSDALWKWGLRSRQPDTQAPHGAQDEAQLTALRPRPLMD